MGKAGRFACIFTPMALTIASLVCLIIVGLGGTNKNNSTYNSLYFFRANTTNINVSPSDLGVNIPDIPSAEAIINQTTDKAKEALDVKDFYHVSLWNYCTGDFDDGKDKVTYCSPRKNEFWFNPVEIWGLNNTGIDKLFSKELRAGLNAYQKAAKWMFIAYVVAVVTTIVEIFVGIFALFSRLGSLATTIVSTISSFFLIAFALTATILYATLMGSFNDALKKYNIRGSLGHNMFVVAWLAVAFSFGAGLFWLLSSCCCSGRSNRIKYGDESGRKGKYERVDSPYGHREGPAFFQSGPGYQAPHHGVPLNIKTINVVPNCTLWAEGKDYTKYHADPDIAGIGVIFAFAGNSFVTITIAIAGLFFEIIRGLQDNTIDKWVLCQVQKIPLLRANKARTKFWQPIMESLILALSDQQLLTGISVLITGFSKHCSISVYHFAIISDLAWFSSNTNLTALQVLQIYLVQRPPQRNWRVCLMLVIFVGLLLATIIEGHRFWFESWNSPARCLLDDLSGNIGGEPAKWMAAQTVMLIFNYSVSIIQLFDSEMIDYYFWELPIRTTERATTFLQQRETALVSSGKSNAYFTSFALVAARVLLSAANRTFISVGSLTSSVAITLCLDIVWFALGIQGIIGDRDIPASQVEGNENAWGFGQIVQVLLLTSAVLTFKDVYTEQALETSNNAGDTGTELTEQPQNQPDDASSNCIEDSEPAHVTLARADTEAGGRGEGATGTSTDNFPSGHTFLRRTTK
ncbi:MAG: hypothetical protein Q9166_004337 [cf. Caloplaca sp. 2 TL-2023]